MKTAQIRKAPPTCKSSRPNTDDTDTKDDSDSCNAAVSSSNPGVDKWKTYLNTHEDIPEGMGIVRWWGVSVISHLRASLILDQSMVVEWFPISNMAFTRWQLPCCNGIVCSQ